MWGDAPGLPVGHAGGVTQPSSRGAVSPVIPAVGILAVVAVLFGYWDLAVLLPMAWLLADPPP